MKMFFMSQAQSVISIDTRELARRVRINALRMTSRGGSAHVASCLSIADILSVLYGRILNITPSSIKSPDRDRFILSKGHAGAAVYSTLAEMGFIPTDVLQSHYQDGSSLSGHVSHKGIPGVEISTGALGHGLSIGAGIAYSGLLDKRKFKVFVLLSDGECDEGSVWEAAMFAAHHKLSNLVAIIDYNKIQSLGSVSDTLELEPFADKWRSFGWAVKETPGHNHDSLIKTLGDLPITEEKPSCIIAHTTKGKGISFMENKVLWHYRTAKGEELEAGLVELESNLS